MPIEELPVIRSWMKLRGWRGDIWNFLNNIETHIQDHHTELLAAVGLLLATDSRTYNIRIAVINREYSQVLPDGTKALDLKTVDGTAIRWAFESGRVWNAARGAPVRPYSTLATNESYSKENLNLIGKTIYFACSTAMPMVELICYI